MKTAQLRVRTDGSKAVGTVTITDAAVRAGIAQYDALHPQNEYPRTEDKPHVKTWFQNDTYKYAIRYQGSCYPPKEILRLAIGRGPQQGCTLAGGRNPGSAITVIEELGFEIISKQECREAT